MKKQNMKEKEMSVCHRLQCFAGEYKLQPCLVTRYYSMGALSYASPKSRLFRVSSGSMTK